MMPWYLSEESRDNQSQPNGLKYRTADELQFVRELAAAGKRDAVRGLLATLDLRRWDGPGIAVDREAVREELRKALGGL